MSKVVDLTIIPAQPGYYTIHRYCDDGSEPLYIGDPVVGWRIETCKYNSEDEYQSFNYPITIDYIQNNEVLGVLLPDKTVLLFEVGIYESLEQANSKIDSNKKNPD